MVEERDNQSLKIWLDYLARLNDRNERHGQLSGLNSWVLLSIIVGLLYKGIPSLPALLADRNALHASEILFALELSCLVVGNWLYLDIIAYLNRGYTSQLGLRALTARTQKEGALLAALLITGATSLGIYEIWLLSTNHGIPRSTTLALLASAISSVFLGLIGTLVLVALLVIRSKYKLDIPLFRGAHSKSSDLVDAWMLVLFVICVVGSIAYVRSVARYWVWAISGASYMVGLLWASVRLVSFRIHREYAGEFQLLEQEIMLGQISEDQIREKFTERLIGKDLHNFLLEFSNRTKSQRERWTTLLHDAEIALADVRSLDDAQKKIQQFENYIGRVRILSGELKKGYLPIVFALLFLPKLTSKDLLDRPPDDPVRVAIEEAESLKLLPERLERVTKEARVELDMLERSLAATANRAS